MFIILRNRKREEESEGILENDNEADGSCDDEVTENNRVLPVTVEIRMQNNKAITSMVKNTAYDTWPVAVPSRLRASDDVGFY